jgi:hypothetical protein
MRLLLLTLHICGGITGMLSGAAAMTFRKGSRWHGIAGNVFFVAMLTMGSSGTILALMKHQMNNIFGGILACYLVATAWLTAKRRDGETSLFDWGALVVALAMGVRILAYGLEAARSPKGSISGVPAGMFFFLGSVAVLAAAGDIRMLMRGVFGTKRVIRHLWRMCFSFFIATGSFFLGQQQVFPVAWRGAAVWFVPALLPLVLLIFWLFRVWFTTAYRTKGVRPQAVSTD